MREKYVIVSKLERIQQAFAMPMLECDFDLEDNYFVESGEYIPVISSDNPHRIEIMTFGIPSLNKNSLITSVRAEGKRNLENSDRYKGPMGIFTDKQNQQSIRYRRCLIIADAFISGTKDNPYLVYPRNKKRPFSIAGIWKEWKDKDTGELQRGLAMITTYPNELINKVNGERCPVIISNYDQGKWLRTGIDITGLSSLLSPFDSVYWNAYAIDPSKIEQRDKTSILPVAQSINKEYNPAIKVQYNTPKRRK